MKTLDDFLEDTTYQSDSITPEIRRKAVLEAVKAWIDEWSKEYEHKTEGSMWTAGVLDVLSYLRHDLDKELGHKTFKAYLRCKRPSESCFACGFIIQCRVLNNSPVNSELANNGEKKQ